jgi:hypothetical protein
MEIIRNPLQREHQRKINLLKQEIGATRKTFEEQLSVMEAMKRNLRMQRALGNNPHQDERRELSMTRECISIIQAKLQGLDDIINRALELSSEVRIYSVPGTFISLTYTTALENDRFQQGQTRSGHLYLHNSDSNFPPTDICSRSSWDEYLRHQKHAAKAMALLGNGYSFYHHSHWRLFTFHRRVI